MTNTRPHVHPVPLSAPTLIRSLQPSSFPGGHDHAFIYLLLYTFVIRTIFRLQFQQLLSSPFPTYIAQHPQSQKSNVWSPLKDLRRVTVVPCQMDSIARRDLEDISRKHQLIE